MEYQWKFFTRGSSSVVGRCFFPVFLFTQWLAEAWEDYSTNCQDQITKAFKRCGQYNDMNGGENHLVKVEGIKDYEVPSKESPQLEDPLKKKRKVSD